MYRILNLITVFVNYFLVKLVYYGTRTAAIFLLVDVYELPSKVAIEAYGMSTYGSMVGGLLIGGILTLGLAHKWGETIGALALIGSLFSFLFIPGQAALAYALLGFGGSAITVSIISYAGALSIDPRWLIPLALGLYLCVNLGSFTGSLGVDLFSDYQGFEGALFLALGVSFILLTLAFLRSDVKFEGRTIRVNENVSLDSNEISSPSKVSQPASTPMNTLWFVGLAILAMIFWFLFEFAGEKINIAQRSAGPLAVYVNGVAVSATCILLIVTSAVFSMSNKIYIVLGLVGFIAGIVLLPFIGYGIIPLDGLMLYIVQVVLSIIEVVSATAVFVALWRYVPIRFMPLSYGLYLSASLILSALTRL